MTSTPASLTGLLSGIAGVGWLILAAVVLWFVLPELRRVLRSRDFTIEVAGMKLSAQRASDELARHIEDLQSQFAELRASQEAIPGAERGIDAQWGASAAAPGSTSSRTIWPSPTGQPSLLWADDEPEGNAYEIKALREQGWNIDLARSTSEAARALAARTYDVIVSDLGRVEDGIYQANAGLALVERVRGSGFRGPFLFYTTPDRARADGAQLIHAGATAVAATPLSLRVELDAFLVLGFQRAVGDLLASHCFITEEQGGTAAPWAPDFFGRVGEHWLAIEVLRSSSGVRQSHLAAVADRLVEAARNAEQPIEALIIATPHPIEPPTLTRDARTVRLMALDELREFVSSLSTAGA